MIKFIYWSAIITCWVLIAVFCAFMWWAVDIPPSIFWKTCGLGFLAIVVGVISADYV